MLDASDESSSTRSVQLFKLLDEEIESSRDHKMRKAMAEGKPMRMSETWEKNSDPNYHVLAWMAAKGPPEPESYLDRVRAEKRSEEPAEIIAHYAHDVRKSILMKNPYLRMSYRAPDDPVVKKPMPDVFLGKIKSDVTQGFEIGYARSYS